MNSPQILNNRYEIQEALGHGGLSTTYRAIDRQTQQECAIKCLSFRKIKEWKTWELFEREARVLKNLHHPKIPRYLDFFMVETDTDVELYLVQEYLGGKSLALLVQEGRHFTEREVITMALKICGVLDYLHHLSPPIIHRDIKPSNITITPDDRLFLIDFGAVQETLAADYARSSGATIVGTYGYMPLEQFEGRAVPASDIYSLGMTLLYLLSHKEPAEMEKTGMQIDVRRYVQVSEPFVKVLTKMTAPDALKRYQSATELKQDLTRLHKEYRAPDETVARKQIGMVAALAVLLLLVGLSTYWYYSAQRQPKPPTPVEITEFTSVPATVTPTPFVSVMTVAPTLTPEPFTPTPQPTHTATAAPTPTFPPTPSPTMLSGPVIQGRLWFDGQRITQFTEVQPSFWFRSEDTNQEQTTQVKYEHGTFEIYGLPAGNLGISVIIDANIQNPRLYPGDFKVFQLFSVSAGFNPELDVNMEKVIHLTSPQDNNAVLSNECSNMMIFPSPVTFRWDSLNIGESYEYQMKRLDCTNFYPIETVQNTTLGNTITLNLPSNQLNECYSFVLSAYKENRRVGRLITHSISREGWAGEPEEYFFRVK